MCCLFFKVENVENRETMLEVCKELRVERERQKDLANQRQDESLSVQQLQQRAARLSHQLRELRQSSLGASPQGTLSETVNLQLMLLSIENQCYNHITILAIFHLN